MNNSYFCKRGRRKDRTQITRAEMIVADNIGYNKKESITLWGVCSEI